MGVETLVQEEIRSVRKYDWTHKCQYVMYTEICIIAIMETIVGNLIINLVDSDNTDGNSGSSLTWMWNYICLVLLCCSTGK